MTSDFVHVFTPGRSDSTLLILHGTGGNEHDLLSLGQFLMPDAALLSPRGKVLENGKPRFFRRLAEGVLDQEDMEVRTHELASFIEGALVHYARKPEGLAAMGYSNGANMAASLMLRYPKLIKRAVLLRPMVPFEPGALPDLAGTKVFIAAGRQDPLVPAPQSEALAKMLERAEARVTLHWDAGGHHLSQEELGAARDWLKTT